MIILDEPYASELLLDWMEDSFHPVLDSAFVRKVARGRHLNCIAPQEAIRRVDEGERLYTNSENTLSWIIENTHNEDLKRTITLFKDKASIREVLAQLDPGFFFKTYSYKELQKVDFSQLNTPFVLKPSVGFCSMGVYVIKDVEDWTKALNDIQENSTRWAQRYPQSVVGVEQYLLEEYIEGVEYALDAYFDSEGQAHVLNILRHDFSSPQDTSDRMYITSSSLVEEMQSFFTTWLNRVNELVGARNFPVHPEVRVHEGRIRLIEFNPLRFAGLGGTDVSFYAYGYRTYEAFLEKGAIDFEQASSKKSDTIFVMSLLNPPTDTTGLEQFDYDKLVKRFSRVLDMRPFDVQSVGSYGFLFLEVSEKSQEEIDFLMHSDLKEFLR